MANSGNPYSLTAQQWQFVQEYLLDLNASAAYRRAGYKCNPKAAEASASRLLSNAKVSKAIQVEKAQRALRMQINQEKVLEEIVLLAHSSVEHYQIDDSGHVQLVPGAPSNAMRAVSGIKRKVLHTEHGVSFETELRLWNKPASVRMAGEHLDLFGQAPQLPDIHVHITAARERIAGKLASIAARQEAQA